MTSLTVFTQPGGAYLDNLLSISRNISSHSEGKEHAVLHHNQETWRGWNGLPFEIARPKNRFSCKLWWERTCWNNSSQSELRYIQERKDEWWIKKIYNELNFFSAVCYIPRQRRGPVVHWVVPPWLASSPPEQSSQGNLSWFHSRSQNDSGKMWKITRFHIIIWNFNDLVIVNFNTQWNIHMHTQTVLRWLFFAAINVDSFAD